MLGTFLRFELRYRLRQPAVYVFSDRKSVV
mgnify:CR=1 FL=1